MAYKDQKKKEKKLLKFSKIMLYLVNWQMVIALKWQNNEKMKYIKPTQ